MVLNNMIWNEFDKDEVDRLIEEYVLENWYIEADKWEEKMRALLDDTGEDNEDERRKGCLFIK